MIDNSNKKDLHNRWNTKILLKYIYFGFQKVIRTYKLIIFYLVYIFFFLMIWINRQNIWKVEIQFLKKPYEFCISLMLMISFILIFFAIIFFIGKPIGAKRINDNLHRMGLTNNAGEAPILISKSKTDRNSKMMIWKFETCGIPISEWQDKQEKIESALNVRIDYIEQGKDCRQIIIHCVDGKNSLPDKIYWKSEKLSAKSFELILGESLTDCVKVDLSKVPHILIGGSTGSGKSVLLKLLLMQSVCKGAKVYIADFKGGVDFPSVWHKKCEIITEQNDLINILEKLVSEIQNRKLLLRENSCANIDEYNQKCEQSLERIIIGCDEIAEVLDKTGLDKSKKELVSKIEYAMSVIARQGRAFGVHLIIATQRPDANILNGQIRNNIDIRICGRADDVLSQIILDNTDASDKIPKNSQGRFLTNSGILFQSYYFNDVDWN